MARLDEFVSGRMPVTVLDSRADGPDDRLWQEGVPVLTR